jgi:uncharacterized protein YjdB
MGEFLDRAKSEFKILGKNDYRLYGNQLGQYPVTTKVLGGFTAENLTKENQAGISEFLINSHGQWNNIDKCWFENEEEKRESLINSSTINTVLSANPYYLDCWTCSNAYEMLSDGLAVTALKGNSIGVFACTTAIANNGVDCHASMDMLKHCNFYWFYYNYLSSLNAGNTRARAFYDAQVAYANSLIADSAEGIGIANGQRIAGNFQFNLYNLLGYHNFGVMEPWTVTGNNSYNNPSGGSSTPGSTIKPVALPNNIVVSQKADIKALTGKSYGKYTVEPKTNGSITSKGLLTAKKPGLFTITGYIKDGKNWVADAVYTISVEQPSTRYFALDIQEIGETVNLAQEVLVCLTVTPTWSSSNPKIATVDPTTGVLTTVKKGKAKITATYGEGKYAAKYAITIQVGVTPAMNKKALTIVPGDTPQIDLKNANYLKDTTWASSDPSIVQVSGWGNLKAISAGTATITATHNGKDYTCIVTVKKPALSTKKISLKVGAKKKIKLKNSKLSNVEWTSSDESIVKVDENGQFTGVSKGSAEISTTTGGCTYVCVVTVK